MWAFFVYKGVYVAIAFKKKLVENKLAAKFVSSRDQLISRVGNTDLLDLSDLLSAGSSVKLYAKAEWQNPGGSVKDRAALNMVLEGEKSGALTKGKIILDATSGNTGISYAMIGAAFGYKVKLATPANVGGLFKKILLAHGAELSFSDAQQGSDGAILKARRLYKENPDLYFYPDQYNNDANWQAHYKTTGVEIIEQTNGEITHFVAGLGTSGTFTGTARRLKEFNQNIKVYSMQPDSPFHGLEGLKHMETAIVPGFYDPGLADENMEVSTEAAQEVVKKLARQQGLLVGISSGAAVAASIEVANKLTSGVVVTILPDNAHKYFDQRFWSEEDGAKN